MHIDVFTSQPLLGNPLDVFLDARGGQGVEMKRPSDIFVRAGRDGDNIVKVRVGGYAMQTMEGEFIL